VTRPITLKSDKSLSGKRKNTLMAYELGIEGTQPSVKSDTLKIVFRIVGSRHRTASRSQ